MGVTAIKRIENRSSLYVVMWNMEKSDEVAELRAQSYDDVDVWIPWCTRSRDFPNHHILLRYALRDHWEPHYERAIWQAAHKDGDYVRTSTPPEFQTPGERVGGVARVNGDRRLVLSDDGGVSLHRDFPSPEIPGTPWPV